jgi:electron transport complex protein RnfB
MWIAVATITAIALMAGLLLSYANRRLPAKTDDIVTQVNDLLPQTQCAQCGFPGCRPYAVAVADGTAGINLCPPGGEETIRKLATLLGRDIIPLNASANTTMSRSVALIDEFRCIGCMHCRNACPVDAIVGTHQMMHTIIASECTGCELCLPPCPVDCITMEIVR